MNVLNQFLNQIAISQFHLAKFCNSSKLVFFQSSLILLILFHSFNFNFNPKNLNHNLQVGLPIH